MSRAVSITRTDLTASALRSAACRSKDAEQVRCSLALALVLEGHARSEAATQTGMDRRTLRDWAHRDNAEGIEGLRSRRSPGRAPSLTDLQKAELKAMVIKGPDLARHGVVRWRSADLKGEVARRFSVEVHDSTVGKWLRQLGLTRVQPRPFHPKKDAAKQEALETVAAPC